MGPLGILHRGFRIYLPLVDGWLCSLGFDKNYPSVWADLSNTFFLKAILFWSCFHEPVKWSEALIKLKKHVTLFVCEV